MYSDAYIPGLEEFLSAETMEMMGIAFAAVAVVGFIAFLVGILNYVFMSLSLYTVGKRRGLRLYGMGWVPFGQEWLLGCIADQYDRKAKGKDKKLGRFLLIGSLVSFVVFIAAYIVMLVGAFNMISQTFMGMDPAAGGMAMIIVPAILVVLVCIFLIVWAVFCYIALYKFFKSCSPKNAVWMLVLSIVIGGLFTSICMLCVRKKDGGFEELQQEEPAEEPAQEYTYTFPQNDSEEE